MTDYTRYQIDESQFTSGVSLVCQDCEAPDGVGDFVVWDDTGEQVTPLCLTNLLALADEHEQQHHAEAHDVAISQQIARGVAMFMNAEHPDPNGGAWTFTTIGDDSGGDGDRPA